MDPAQSSATLTTAGGVAVAMAVLAALETLAPLRARDAWSRAHLGPNLALTLVTLGTNAALGAALVLALAWRRGAAAAWEPSGLAEIAAAVAALDLATWAAHAAMHRSALLWRFHRVHHADPTVDVTTALRQHPGETLLRHAFLAAAAVSLGVAPAAFAAYRTWSALQSLVLHANLRLPRRLDALLATVLVTPDLHKMHHSRRRPETNSNYGNLFSLYDRALGTFAPATRDVAARYGLDGFDERARQTVRALLAAPFGGGAGLQRRQVGGRRPAEPLHAP